MPMADSYAEKHTLLKFYDIEIIRSSIALFNVSFLDTWLYQGVHNHRGRQKEIFSKVARTVY